MIVKRVTAILLDAIKCGTRIERVIIRKMTKKAIKVMKCVKPQMSSKNRTRNDCVNHRC